MVKVDIYRDKNGNIISYRVAGHAGCEDEDGYDLVCNSVSVLTQAPLIGMEQYLIDEESGIFTLKLDEADANTQAILETMYLALLSVERQFPQFVRVKAIRR